MFTRFSRLIISCLASGFLSPLGASTVFFQHLLVERFVLYIFYFTTFLPHVPAIL